MVTQPDSKQKRAKKDNKKTLGKKTPAKQKKHQKVR